MGNNTQHNKMKAKYRLRRKTEDAEEGEKENDDYENGEQALDLTPEPLLVATPFSIENEEEKEEVEDDTDDEVEQVLEPTPETHSLATPSVSYIEDVYYSPTQNMSPPRTPAPALLTPISVRRFNRTNKDHNSNEGVSLHQQLEQATPEIQPQTPSQQNNKKAPKKRNTDPKPQKKTKSQPKKDSRRTKQIRNDQLILKKQIHDMETKLEIILSLVSTSYTTKNNSVEIPRPKLKTKDSQTNNTHLLVESAEKPSIATLKNRVEELEEKCEEQNKIIMEHKKLEEEFDELMTTKANQLTDLTISLCNKSKLVVEMNEEAAKRIAEKDREKKRQITAPPARPKPPLIQAPITNNNNSNTTKKELPKAALPTQNNETTQHHQPDILLYHDSIGKPIKDTIFKNENLQTQKRLTYTLEDTLHDINSIKQLNHKTVIIHVGTNDIRNNHSDAVISKMEEVVDAIRTKAPATSIVISSITTRQDNTRFRHKLEYVNEKIKVKYGQTDNVSVLENNNITREHLADDRVHLVPIGTSRLAFNIKKHVAKILNINLAKKKVVKP